MVSGLLPLSALLCHSEGNGEFIRDRAGRGTCRGNDPGGTLLFLSRPTSWPPGAFPFSPLCLSPSYFLASLRKCFYFPEG